MVYHLIKVLNSTNNSARQNILAQGDLCGKGHHCIIKNRTKTSIETRKREFEQLLDVDYVPTNTYFLKVSSCTFFEYNEAVIKMVIKFGSPTVKHVSRTHRVGRQEKA